MNRLLDVRSSAIFNKTIRPKRAGGDGDREVPGYEVYARVYV